MAGISIPLYQTVYDSVSRGSPESQAVCPSDIASLMTLEVMASLLEPREPFRHLIGVRVALTPPWIHLRLNPRRRCLRRPSRREGCFATGTEEVRYLATQDRQGMAMILVSLSTPMVLMSPTLVLAASMR